MDCSKEELVHHALHAEKVSFKKRILGVPTVRGVAIVAIGEHCVILDPRHFRPTPSHWRTTPVYEATGGVVVGAEGKGPTDMET